MHDDQKGGQYVKLSCDFVLGINHLTWGGDYLFSLEPVSYYLFLFVLQIIPKFLVENC